MKRNELTQIKSADKKELLAKVKTLKTEIADLVMDKNMKKLKDVKSVSKKKKDMAQILTIIRQKEMLEQLESRVESQESGKEKLKDEKKKGENS